jgi:hypothetical protein
MTWYTFGKCGVSEEWMYHRRRSSTIYVASLSSLHNAHNLMQNVQSRRYTQSGVYRPPYRRRRRRRRRLRLRLRAVRLSLGALDSSTTCSH